MLSRNSTKIIIVLSLIFGVSGCIQTQYSSPTQKVEVVEITDGDTLEAIKNGEIIEIRLLGVDTPEIYGNVNPSEFNVTNKSCLDKVADDASKFMENRLLGENISIEYSSVQDRTDQYGRTLAWIHHNGQNINLLLIEKGLGRYYREGRYTPEMTASLEEANAKAQISEKGYRKCN